MISTPTRKRRSTKLSAVVTSMSSGGIKERESGGVRERERESGAGGAGGDSVVNKRKSRKLGKISVDSS